MGVCIGVDVAKNHLDWVLGPKGEVERIDNSPAAVRRLVRRLRKLDFDRVILESTGQYERLLYEALEDAGVRVARVNPFRVRRFGEGMGVLAKNDSIDARLLALFGDKVEPEERPKKTDRERLLGDLSARRRQLIANLTAEKNRLEHASGYVAKEIKSLIRTVERHIEKLESKIDQLIAEDERQREDFARLQSVPGVGPKVARSLIVDLPELGKLDRRRISSLVGLAPYANDSGQKQGKRSIHGGRSAPRTMLYLAAMVGSRFTPELAAMKLRLQEAGKPPKVILIACARKLLTILNAIVRDQSEWKPRPA
jgi:transposase